MNGEESENDDFWVFPMLEMVKEHQLIWDKGHEDHKNYTMRKAVWNTIAEMLKEKYGVKKTGQEVSVKWKYVTDGYKRTKTIPLTGSEEGISPKKKSKYSLALSYLDGRTIHRRTCANLPSPVNVAATATASSSSSSSLTSVDVINDTQNASAASAISLISPNLNSNEQEDSLPPTPSSLSTDQRIIEVLEQRVNAQLPPSTTSSQFANYGDIVVRILENVPSNARRRALRDLMRWICVYEDYGVQMNSDRDDGMTGDRGVDNF